jgi:hypothetical protein
MGGKEGMKNEKGSRKRNISGCCWVMPAVLGT